MKNSEIGLKEQKIKEAIEIIIEKELEELKTQRYDLLF